MSTKDLKQEINGRDVFCVQWSAEKALLMKLKLIKEFGPLFAVVALGATKEGNDLTEIIDSLQRALINSEPEKTLSLMKEVVQSATVGGKRIDDSSFNEIFSGKLFDFYRIFIAVLRLNYEDFLPAKLGQTIKDVVTKIELPS